MPKVRAKNKANGVDDDNFIMSPKYDFVFKYIFGNENNKEPLIALLRDILGLPDDEFEVIEIINSELLKEFKEDKKGILDVRVKTKLGKQIDVEIQILPTDYMAERTMFYWSKMYTSQIKPGDTYDKLKKCVTINIVDFKCTPLKKPYSRYHLTEDETGYRLTDIIEVHYLEIPKLSETDINIDENDPIVQWMKFVDAKSKGELEMLAEKNKDIRKAYDMLQVISKNEMARMRYDAIQAEISDQRTRIKSAELKGREEGREEGINIGIEKGRIELILKQSRKGLSIEYISEINDFDIEYVKDVITKQKTDI